ncbi:MAG: HAD-IA family hydrolase [Actinomycetota bacterium]|nr:HAD-IA family hydrolase [Actinomycetota bacterium]
MTAVSLVEGAEGLLVDLDGTLVDSTAPVHRVWTAFAHRHGLDPAHVLRFAQGRPSRETVGRLAPEADLAAEAATVEAGEVGDPEGVVALPGAAALLTADRRLAIVTSCSTALARVRLRAAGLPEPGVLVSSDMIKRGKPQPDCFVLGAARLGVAPQRCVVLEDAPAGIAAGRSAGARVIALRTTHRDSELSEADAIIENLASLSQ